MDSGAVNNEFSGVWVFGCSSWRPAITHGIQIAPFLPFNNEKTTFEKPKNWFVVLCPSVIVTE
jgi:hypothetical protein